MKESLYFLLSICSYMLFSQTSDDKVTSATSAAFESQNPEVSISILKSVSDVVEDVNDSLKVEYYLGLGTGYGQIGNSDSSLYYLDIGMEIAEKSQDEFGLLKIYNVQGLVFMMTGQLDESLASYQKAMVIAETGKTPSYRTSLRKVYGNSGGIYYELGQYEKALEVSKKALDLSLEEEDNSGLAYNYLRLALCYNALDSTEKAVVQLQKSSPLLINLQDTASYVYSETTLGQYLEKMGNVDEARYHFLKANEFADQINLTEEQVIALISLARVNLKGSKLNEAEKYAKKALEVSSLNGMRVRIEEADDMLYQIYEAKGDFRKALYHRNSSIELADSLVGVEMQSRIAELETKYETEKKEAEITRLSLENELQEVNIRKAQITQWAIIIVFFGSALFTVVFIRQRQKKQKAESEAQELQIEALKKRFIELHASPSELAVEMSLGDINSKINTPLTEREFDALKLSIEGKTNAEISESLFISVSTVKFHLRNAYSKMGVGNRKEAFEYVLKTS